MPARSCMANKTWSQYLDPNGVAPKRRCWTPRHFPPPTPHPQPPVLDALTRNSSSEKPGNTHSAASSRPAREELEGFFFFFLVHLFLLKKFLLYFSHCYYPPYMAPPVPPPPQFFKELLQSPPHWVFLLWGAPWWAGGAGQPCLPHPAPALPSF